MADKAEKTELRLVDEASDCPAYRGHPHTSKLVQLESDEFVRACIYCGAMSEPRFGDEIKDEVPRGLFIERDDITTRVRVLELRYRPSKEEAKPGEKIYRLQRVHDGYKFERTAERFDREYDEAPTFDMDPLFLRKIVLGEGIIILSLVLIFLGMTAF